jgi:primosomal protein N' (replication factor Y)
VKSIARIEPLLTARAVRGPFDYRLPESMPDTKVGSLLVVPFGRQRVLGVVVGLADSSDVPEEKLVEPIESLEVAVPEDLVEVGLWLGEEYCSTPSRGLGLTLPPGVGGGKTIRKPSAQTDLVVEITPAGRAALDGAERLGSRQKAILRAVAGGERTARELSTEAGADRGGIRKLEERGLLSSTEVERMRRPQTRRIGAPSVEVKLSAAQGATADRIIDAIEQRSGSFLIHGVTGSGKTEVYMAAVQAALERDLGAIVLVPEIALTPQTESRFRDRFGDGVALLHSRMSAGTRYDEWRRLASGDARICVGPRSAVFAPISDLGLIVVDEEHDPSYKQESDPRYDAREVAARRAEEAGAVMVAGTATPRPESWVSLERLDLPERVDGRPLPPVEVVDMRSAGAGPLHPKTLEAFGDLADEGGKAILLLNRRGWAGYLVCRSCGHPWTCPACDVSLVMHRDQGTVRCHHCGHSEPTPTECPECSSTTIAQVGAGTQRVADELERLLEPLPVFRLDSDTVGAGSSHAEVLSRFQAAESGVLVGTQMVAKGHDFPDVTLAVVLDADGALRIPDFRSEERTFSLITQLAGRCGRGDAGGRVLVQALSVNSPSIVHAASHDSPGFLAGELERRRALDYPPFSHLIDLVCAAPDEAAVGEIAGVLASAVSGSLPAGAEMLGPAPLFRVRDRHRRRLMIKTTDRPLAVAVVRDAVDRTAKAASSRGVSISVDVDPQ